VLAALRTQGVVTASLPGWQPDADAGDEPRGRLRLRVGGSTITYRALVVVSGQGPVFTVSAEGTEVRGSGTVTASGEVEAVATDSPEPGTTLRWRGRAAAEGRLTSYEEAVVSAAVHRLLDRFAGRLAENAPEEPPAGPGRPRSAAPGPVPVPEDEKQDRAGKAPEGDTPGEGAPGGEGEQVSGGEAARESGEEPDVVDDLGGPPGELEEFELVEVEVEVPESAAALDDLVPPADAAHARRTMIGRSAEEVDHAPPRGRYAPVPAPHSGTGAAALRWAGPAAAALVASAVVVGRVLRRRR
jgi:carbon monoxide dehydrogenase subunit G